MKKLIFFFVVQLITSAQTPNLGLNIALDYASFEKTYTSLGFWGEVLKSTKEDYFPAISINVDLTTEFHNFASSIFELGVIFGSQSSNYKGLNAALYYSTNKLLRIVYLKTGFLLHANYSSNAKFANGAIFIGSIGIGFRVSAKSCLEGYCRIPITKSYAKDTFTEFKLNGLIIGLGLKFLI